MKTAIATIFTTVLTFPAFASEPEILKFSSASKGEFSDVRKACSTNILKGIDDTVAKSQNLVLYRSAKGCKKVSGRSYCPTFFLNTHNELKCTVVLYTRGHARFLDQDEMSWSSLIREDHIPGAEGFVIDAEHGAITVKSAGEYFEINLNK